MDYRLYDRLGKVFEATGKYEKYFVGDMIEDVGVYNTFKSRFNKRNEPYNNHMCTVETVKNLVKNNILCGVTGGWYPLDKYSTLICSCLTGEDEYDFERIIEYVKNGGNLYFSGGDCPGLIKEFFGAEVEGSTREHVVYISPEESEEKYFEGYSKRFPLHFDGYAPVTKGMKKENILAKITLPYTSQDSAKFVSIHSNPPGVNTEIPAMAYTEYGKGKVLWSALPIEALDLYDYIKIFRNLILDKLKTKQRIKSNAPEDVELVAFNSGDSLLISCVKLNVKHDAESVQSFEIIVEASEEPESIELLEKNEKLDYIFENNHIIFKTKELNIFDMYKINF